MLEGVLADDDGSCGAGDFVWRPAGSRHPAWSPEGCLVLGIFQVPNKFFEQGGRVTDILGAGVGTRPGASAGNLKAGGVSRGRLRRRGRIAASQPYQPARVGHGERVAGRAAPAGAGRRPAGSARVRHGSLRRRRGG